MSDFKFGGLSVEMQPSITKWGFEDLGDDPTKHRWRAWWASSDGETHGIELRAYPVIKVNPASVWINEDNYRTAGVWDDFDPGWMRKRICYNGAGAAWAKPTQDEAIRSLAIRLCRWTARLHTEMKRAESAISVLGRLRPEWSAFSQTARAHLKGNIDWRNPE
jgi:hypothetical protein